MNNHCFGLSAADLVQRYDAHDARDALDAHDAHDSLGPMFQLFPHLKHFKYYIWEPVIISFFQFKPVCAKYNV